LRSGASITSLLSEDGLTPGGVVCVLHKGVEIPQLEVSTVVFNFPIMTWQPQ